MKLSVQGTDSVFFQKSLQISILFLHLMDFVQQHEYFFSGAFGEPGVSLKVLPDRETVALSYDKKCDKGIFVEILQLRSALVEQIFQRDPRIFLKPGGVKFLSYGMGAFFFNERKIVILRAPERVGGIMGGENDEPFQMLLILMDQIIQGRRYHLFDFFKKSDPA